MLRSVRMPRSVIALVSAALLVAAATGSAAASDFGAPQVHYHFDFTIPDDNVCGLPVVSHFSGVLSGWEMVNSDGLLQFKEVDQTTHTITNPANGHWVTWFDAEQTTDISAVPLTGNLIQVTTAVIGVPELVRSWSGGQPLTMDVGWITFVAVIDDGGTPLDTSDDHFVSATIGGVDGPHPDAEIGVFCAAVLPVLS